MSDRLPIPIPIPGRAEDITAGWMTAALRSAGFDVEVASVDSEPVGTGQMARSVRYWVEYATGGGPATVVAKFAASDPTSRAAGAAGGYPNEVNFYRHLAATVSVSVPKCHYADLSEDGSEFVLVLDDLAPATQGDQIAGSSLAEAEAAVDNLVGLHAPRWCDPTLRDLPWLAKPSPASAEFLGAIMIDDTARFVERYRTRLSDAETGVLTRFAAACSRWSGARPEPFALLHGDYRLDNIMFDRTADPVAVSAVDWQTLALDLPAKDVAYFLGNSLPTDLRRAHERDLVARYHDGLVAAGVTSYSLDRCFEDYAWGQFHGLQITVLGAMHVIQTSRGDDMFMAMASRHCAAIADLDAESLLAG